MRWGSRPRNEVCMRMCCRSIPVGGKQTSNSTREGPQSLHSGKPLASLFEADSSNGTSIRFGPALTAGLNPAMELALTTPYAMPDFYPLNIPA
jgi:hypothetical protein